MLQGFSREPGLVGQLPQWIRDAKVRKNPLEYRQPWWNYPAVNFVGTRLRAGARVFEYGGGASTLWLLDRPARVTTIEDDARDWFAGLRARMPDLTWSSFLPPLVRTSSATCTPSTANRTTASTS